MTSRSALVLVDSNVLVYCHDEREARKRGVALTITELLIEAGRLALSVQCLTEFYRTSTERLRPPLARATADREVRRLALAAETFPLTPNAVLEATRVASSNAVSIWDALIWAVAAANGIDTVLTEDIRDTIDGVRFVNPFEPGFEVESL